MTSSTSSGSTTRTVFLVGATGGVGKRVIAKLTADGHSVTGLHHSPDDADTLRDAGAHPVRGDIAADSVDDFAGRIAGHDAVIFCAGAGGGDQVDAIDGAGPGKIAQAAAKAGVNRFVLVSVFMDAWRGDESPGEGFERYMAAKRHADVDVAATDLDYLLVHPGTLTDDDGTGTITAGTAVAYHEKGPSYEHDDRSTSQEVAEVDQSYSLGGRYARMAWPGGPPAPVVSNQRPSPHREEHL